MATPRKSPSKQASASNAKRPPRKAPRAPAGDVEMFRAHPKKRVPFEFVLDELADRGPETRPMFGCVGVYVGDKIVMILRDRPTATHDNGVWIATTPEHHASLLAELPSLRSITVLGEGVTGWQAIPADAPDFEDAVLRACALVRAGDPRIGKVPVSRRVSRPAASK